MQRERRLNRHSELQRLFKKMAREAGHEVPSRRRELLAGPPDYPE